MDYYFSAGQPQTAAIAMGSGYRRITDRIIFVQHAPALPLLAIRLHRILVRCANKARPAEPRKLKSTSSLNGPAVIQSTELTLKVINKLASLLLF